MSTPWPPDSAGDKDYLYGEPYPDRSAGMDGDDDDAGSPDRYHDRYDDPYEPYDLYDDDADRARHQARDWAGAWGGSMVNADDTDIDAPPAPSFWHVAGGLVLILLGTELLLERIIGVEITLIPAALGLLMLAWSVRTGTGWASLFGWVVLGWGIGQFAGDLVGGPTGAGLASLGTAGGLAVTAARHRATWAWILAALMAAGGAASLGVGIASAPAAPGIVLPAILMAAGMVLLARDTLPRRTGRILLAGLMILFLAVAAARVG